MLFFFIEVVVYPLTKYEAEIVEEDWDHLVPQEPREIVRSMCPVDEK